MQLILAAIAAGASVLGVLYALISRRGEAHRVEAPAAEKRTLLIFLLVGIVLLFLLTVPSFPPFSPGMTLGWGFLLGSLLGFGVLFTAVRAVGVLAAAALGPALLLLIFHGYPNEALIGCALGALFVAAASAAVLRPLAATGEETVTLEDDDTGWTRRATLGSARGVEMYALVSVAIAVGARLAIDHFDKPSTVAIEKSYWAFPAIMVAAGMLAAILLAHEWQGKWQRWGALLNGAGAAAIAVLVTAVLQLRLLTKLDWTLPLYGLLAFTFLLAVFTRERQVDAGEDSRPVPLAFASALLALAVIAVAFQRLQGYGEVLALLPALLLLAIVTLDTHGTQEPVGDALGIGGVSIMLLLALYRLFVEKVGHGWTLDFQQQYDFFALLLGAGACFALLAFAAQGLTRTQRAREAGKDPMRVLLARTVLLGVLLALTPPVLAALWGVKAVGAFLAGLIVGEAVWMLLAAWMVGKERERILLAAPHLFFIAAAVIAVQFTHLALAADFSRLDKLIIAGTILLVLLSWIFVDALAGARGARKDSGS